MKATDFEYRHQTLVHQLIVGAAFLTYLIDRDDIVWRLVKRNTSQSRTLFFHHRDSVDRARGGNLHLRSRPLRPKTQFE